MPVVLCESSKATPEKGINYIMDPIKVLASGSQGFATTDPKGMADQMMRTMHLFGKGYDRDERKYYHSKISFDPQDLPENGGTLTPEKANEYAARYAAATWPGREVVWTVQQHGEAMHIHCIVGACLQATGKKLDARNAEYRRWKDYAQELAGEMGLSTLDWRRATKEKRAQERQSDLPVKETFAEEGIAGRKEVPWKAQLRNIIDQAAASCSSMTEFRATLESQGVTLTRCTEQTISYKMGEHKACRGDSLGGDYTVAAIRGALQHNDSRVISKPAPEAGKEKIGLDALISYSAKKQSLQMGGRAFSKEDIAFCREFGRLAGFTRAQVDEMLDNAPAATWEEKQKIWAQQRAEREAFWAEYKKRKEALEAELDANYKARKMLRHAQWAIDPRNRRKTLVGVLFALVYITTHDSDLILEIKADQLRLQQKKLREEMVSFKTATGDAVNTLREKGLSVDDYMASVLKMQKIADELYEKARKRKEFFEGNYGDGAVGGR